MENNNRPVYINITAMGVVKIMAIFVLFYFIFLIREIIALLFIALILASALDPLVDWMQQKKIPRGVGVFFIYLVMFSAVASVMFLLYAPIVEQTRQLIENFPQIFEKVISGMSILREFAIENDLLNKFDQFFQSIGSNVDNAAGSVFGSVVGFFGGIFSFFLVLVVTFYMVVEENAIKKIVWSIAPVKYQIYIMNLLNRMQKKVGLWLRGQLILSLIIFCLTYVGLLILGVEYSLVLALIAGMTEFVPYLGPLMAAIPAIFLAMTQKPMLAVFVAILYYIIQLVENNIIVPKLMQKVVGLNPIISIAVLLIGFKVAGIIGAVMSIPVATALNVFLQDVFDRRLPDENSPQEE